MTKASKRLTLYLALLLPITIIAVALRTVALLLHLDENLIYFESGALITAGVVIMTLFCLFSLTYCFLPKQNITPASSFLGPQTYIPSGLAAISLIFVGFELILSLATKSSSAEKSLSSLTSVILLLAVIFCFVSIVCFFLNVFFEKRESRTRAAFTLSTVLFLAIYAGYLFFSDELPLNAPNKSADQMAHLALSIFFLYETRISLGRSLWKPYVSFGMTAAALAFFSSIPSLIFYFANGASEGAVISASIAENVLVLTLGIYVICRLSLLLTLVPDETCNMALAVEKMAKLREEELILAEKNRRLAENAERPQTTQDTEKLEGTNYEMDIASLTDTTIAEESDKDTSAEKE